MAIIKAKNGTYIAKVGYRNERNTPTSIEVRFELRREAIKFEANLRDEIAKLKINETDVIKDIAFKLKNGIDLDSRVDNGQKYSDVFDLYMQSLPNTNTERTNKEKRSMSKRYWGELFDRSYLSITKKDYLVIWNKINSMDLAVATKNKIIINLQAVSRFAYDYLDYPDNTKMLQRLSKTSDDITDQIVWTQEQFDTFIKYVDIYHLKALFTFYYDTGTTLSEALALTYNDFEGDVVKITSLQRSKKEGRQRLKNRYRRRNIKLAPKTFDVLKPLLNTKEQYLFGGEEPYSNRQVPRHLELYIDKANKALLKEKKEILPRITVHGFRHSHATNLINKGASIVGVSKRLGHSNITTTLNVYSHLLEDANTEIIDIIEDL